MNYDTQQNVQSTPNNSEGSVSVSQQCAFCANEIYLSSNAVVNCIKCESKSCIACGEQLIKEFGNRLYLVDSMFTNHCYNCNPYEEDPDPAYDSDSDSYIVEPLITKSESDYEQEIAEIDAMKLESPYVSSAETDEDSDLDED
ncbi:hypothetical protein [Clostridium sp.]|uniref:hypothetical protein n=1 Tax=Clostridium sp. TaxID=1506 RepID=UPI00284C1325|nr:hypothetical protein [Clostridium sp.]MDR3596638.1 hypothetical protein [Clostridium sp.]